VKIPFNVPFTTGEELEYIRRACANRHISGDGPFTADCQKWLRDQVGSAAALLTTSGTSALEMAAILAGIGPGDEVSLRASRGGAGFCRHP
jgi:dTDP-4-amino-4,6-dideoxygalactose transaminase